ncbi:MAG: hypothetical protein RL596_1736, partial [Bacteroidota bacterium]
SSIVISRWFPKTETGKAQSAIWAAARIGGALTPLVVIPLVHSLGWRMAFAVLGMVGAVWAFSWYFWFRDEPSEKSGISEEEIKAALKLVYERMKIVVEPSCVVPLAAVLRNRNLFSGKKTGIILTGGNVDLSKFSAWFV